MISVIAATVRRLIVEDWLRPLPHPGAIFVGCAFELGQEWPIHQIDEDAAILNGFDAIRDLDQLARRT
jgi:hypothetical protein